MIYAQGGGAWAKMDSQFVNPLFLPLTTSNSGWYAGGGVDWMLASGKPFSVAIGIDYRHIDLRTVRAFDAPGVCGPNCRDHQGSADVILGRATLLWNPGL